MNKLRKIYSKYSPSKIFLKIMGFCFVFMIIMFFVFTMLTKKESFKNEKHPVSYEERTVLDLIQADTDLDSIPDWEEALWGTDKNKMSTFGLPDSEYIENKKKELAVEQDQTETELEETETEKFAKQFFVAYAAMKSSGDINQETINKFSNELGQKIIDPVLENKYQIGEIKITDQDERSQRITYYSSMQRLFETYKLKGLGEELDIVNKGLVSYSSTGTESSSEELIKIGKLYQDFSKESMKILVPKSLLKYHLDIANSAYNSGVSVLNMNKVVKDPIIGLSGISQYEKYSKEFINSVTNLEDYLSTITGDII